MVENSGNNSKMWDTVVRNASVMHFTASANTLTAGFQLQLMGPPRQVAHAIGRHPCLARFLQQWASAWGNARAIWEGAPLFSAP